MDENENFETTEDFSFGKEIAKTIALSAASTAGVVIGFMAVGLTIEKVQQFKKNRAAKKAQTETN